MSIYEKWKLTPDERMLQGLRLFPHIDAEQLPQKLQSRRLRRDVMEDIRQDPETYRIFQELEAEYQEALVQFCMGNRGMNNMRRSSVFDIIQGSFTHIKIRTRPTLIQAYINNPTHQGASAPCR